MVIVAFGVGWKVTSTASEAVAVAKGYPAPAALDSLGRYLRPMTLTTSEAGTEPADLLSANEYFGPSGAPEPDNGGAATPRAGRPRWIVSAILLTDARRMAVLNDSVVVVGSVAAGGGRVVAIESNHVVLQEPGGARRIVPLNQ